MDVANPIDRSPTHLLHRASQAVELLFAMKATGDVTPRQLAVLVTVEQNEGISQTGIVERTGIDRSTLAEPRTVGAFFASATGRSPHNCDWLIRGFPR